MSMEYDSDISCEDRLRNLEVEEGCSKQQCRHTCQSGRSAQTTGKAWRSSESADLSTRPTLAVANRSLSSQVMEYYHKYSKNANLENYFSLPTTSSTSDALEYYYSVYDISPKLDVAEADSSHDLKSSCVSKERRRWARPPLIGQSVIVELHSPSPERTKQTSQEIVLETLDTDKKSLSPTFSVASHKPLEWDSGADVGYFNTLPYNKQSGKKLSTIERMALVRGSAALRLDPEGTTESGSSAPVVKKQLRPDANSTPLPENVSGSESEIEITPIVKNALPGILTSNDLKSAEKKIAENPNETPNTFKLTSTAPKQYATKNRNSKVNEINRTESKRAPSLKKSTSMNQLLLPATEVAPKRSQSELNLCAGDKIRTVPGLIFNSTSSIATVVNKPMMCDKVIQTNIGSYARESVGVQVTTIEEEKPPLPKRGTSLTQKSLHSILKHSKCTNKVHEESKQNASGQKISKCSKNAMENRNGTRRGSSATSLCESSQSTPQQDDVENVTGRANSFEYFPGHIYENVPDETLSRVSSVETRRSNSTMPNTSSSIEEKLWGDSDSLVRDLERGVNILKSLVDANKCDKQIKKRLIHHVVKRLVSTKYTDDKIEHNLEENVPWNPDDARKKVYRAEIIHALAKKQNTTDSSDDWKPQRQKTVVKKSTESEARTMKEIINLESSSDKFDRNTDRTEMDGRKARMGLRIDDCHNSSNTPSDATKSESSECFLPQRTSKTNKAKGAFRIKKSREHSVTNSTPSDQNRVLLEAVVNDRQNSAESSSERDNSSNWKLPTTLSERQYELRRCSNTDSADTKLVSYAEMEKRNQLIWITNEISHLSDLKKLLEQPKKLERSKSSPRKLRHTTYKEKPVNILPCVQNENGNLERDERDAPDTPDYPINKQWSSHCNLATYHFVRNTNAKNIRHLKKRNSCTQTGSRLDHSYSKTGAEIISATGILKSVPVKMTNIHVQTLPQRVPSSFRSSQRNFQCSQSAACSGSEQICHCYQSQINSKHCICRSNAQKKMPEQSFYDIPQFNSCSCDAADDNIKQKDAKNHLNSSKLQKGRTCKEHEPYKENALTCRCADPTEQFCTSESKTNKKAGSNSSFESNRQFLNFRSNSSDCNCENEEKKEGNVCKHYISKSCNYLPASQKCDCEKDCSCKNKIQDIEEKIRAKQKCSCDKDCSCTNKVRNIKDQVKSSQKCGCNKDCTCKNKIRDIEEKLKPSRQRCQNCGIVYQSSKNCGCFVACPKAVAYELSFDVNKHDNQMTKEDNAETKRVSKKSEPGSSTHRVNTSCSCDTGKFQKSVNNVQRKETLQDYLTSNKPRFIDNVETRRQYLSEISQLRQLRKEKRMQLLAMSSMSDILTSPKPPKKNSCIKKNISEESLKRRLRQRYLRLNEVRAKRRQKEKEEEIRRNRLMARIYCKKLQQKVLSGQVDLSQSVSVISNL